MSTELDALQSEAVAVDAVNTPSVAEQPSTEQAQAVNEAAEIAGLLTIITGLFVPVFPSLAKIYTVETVNSIAAAAVPVMNKHGWTTGEFLGKWAAELGLAAVAIPVGLLTIKGIREDIAQAKEQEKPATAQAITAPEAQPDGGALPDPATFAARG